jgi:hypothetical protein
VKTKIHLVTVVGSDVEFLPHMLAHYVDFGFDSLLVNVHLDSYGDALFDRVRKITDKFNGEIWSVFVGKWLQSVNPFLYAHTLRQKPHDWFVLADLDELQVYPEDLRSFFFKMDQSGFDFVEGCIVDRIARDGSLPKLVNDKTIWEQFPLAGLITYPILKANILKVVAAKGFVRLAPGQHSALNGRGCPREQMFIPVHHFKWQEGLVERLQKRVELYKLYGEPIWPESQKFLDYYEQHYGKVDVADPNFFLAESTRKYPLWGVVKDRVLSIAKANRR